MLLLLFSDRQEGSGALYTFLRTAEQSVISELEEMWQCIASIAARVVQCNGFMSLEQHGFNFVQVTAAWINLVLGDSYDQAPALAVPFR